MEIKSKRWDKEKREAIDKLAKDLALILLAEWIAIEHGKTRLQALEYMEEAQELADYLHTIGYRLVYPKLNGNGV